MADLDQDETIQIIWAKITLRINDYIALDMDYNIDSDGVDMASNWKYISSYLIKHIWHWLENLMLNWASICETDIILREGRRLETGRRSESNIYIYTLTQIVLFVRFICKFVLFCVLTFMLMKLSYLVYLYLCMLHHRCSMCIRIHKSK